ncbi:MAG: hypothetical protein RL885_27985 [Planctomycetota bacterium]
MRIIALVAISILIALTFAFFSKESTNEEPARSPGIVATSEHRSETPSIGLEPSPAPETDASLEELPDELIYPEITSKDLVSQATVRADHKELLRLYRKWAEAGTDSVARSQILVYFAKLSDSALGERFLLEAISSEKPGSDGSKHSALGGMSLGKELWTRNPGAAVEARNRLLGEANSNLQMALMYGLVEHSEAIGSEVLGADLKALYLQSEDSLLRQNLPKQLLRIGEHETAFDVASLGIRRPIVSGRDDGEICSSATALASVYESLPEKRSSIVSTLLETAMRSDISPVTFGYVIDALKEVHPESLTSLRGRIGIPDQSADRYLERALSSSK